MKKNLIIIALLGMIVLLQGTQIVAVDSNSLSSLRPQQDLYQIAKSLTSEGIEVFYYNSTGFMLGLKDAAQTRHIGADFGIIPSLQRGESFYLVTKLENRRLPVQIEQVWDFGSSILIRSSLSDIELRQSIINPFVLIELEPMLFPEQNSGYTSVREETIRSITQLTQAVNADTVLSYIQRLQDFSTRYALADNRLQVSTWIRDQFLRFGISNASLHSFNWNSTTQYNVVATIPGSLNPDEYIIVGGHHDSITNTTPYDFAPGADDNASGTVAALEMARVMMLTGFQPKCSIRFVTFAAEEFGLWGAKAYANYAQNNNLNIRLMINHDMIANSTEGPTNWRVRLMPYDGSWAQSAYASTMTETFTTLHPVYGSTNSASSDSHPFWQKGYPVIYFFEYEFCPWYHSNLDIVANTNPDYCAEVIRASVASAAGVAQMPLSPTNLAVYDVGNGSGLHVDWDDSPDADVVGYYLYIAANGQDAPEPILVQDSQYTVSGLTEGTEYLIQLAAIDSEQNESFRLSKLGIPLSFPLQPQAFIEEPVPGAIRLSWAANTELDLDGYVLYRSQDPSSIGTPVQQTNIHATFYSDSSVNGASGYYYYTLMAIDQSGNPSTYTATLSSRPITLDQGVLIVDETKNLSGNNMFQLTDDQADWFYASLLDNYPIHHWDTEANSSYLRLADLGVYSSVLWHGNDISDMDHPYIVRDALQRYLNAGGKILFSVMVPSQAFELSANYPAVFNQSTFINSQLGISGVQYNNNARFNRAVPALANLPLLNIDVNKVPAAWQGHIFRVEGLEADDAASTLYTYGSASDASTPQGSLTGLSVAVLKQGQAGKAVTLSFPLYYVENDSAREFVQYIWANVFEEELENTNQQQTPAAPLYLNHAYPNPFGNSTQITFQSRSITEPINLNVYNLRGQKVRSLYAGYSEGNVQSITWDGRDDQARTCANGLYFIKLSQGTQHSIRKVLISK